MTKRIGQTTCDQCGGPLSPRTTSGICSTCAWRKRQIKARAVVALARQQPCVDCGATGGRTEFDHVPERGPKKFNIGNGAGKSLGILAREMAKCDLLCSGCHHRRTIRRAGGVHGFAGRGYVRAKLDAARVVDIRQLAAAGESQTSLARRFGVSQMQISRIIRRVDWSRI